MVIFRFFGHNCLKLELSIFVVYEIVIEHWGRYVEEKITRNLSLASFQNRRDKLKKKKSASIFQDAIPFHPGHLQPKTLMLTLRAQVE